MLIHSRFWQELENLGFRILQELPPDSDQLPVLSRLVLPWCWPWCWILWIYTNYEAPKGTIVLVLLRRTVAFFCLCTFRQNSLFDLCNLLWHFSQSALYNHICFRHQLKEGKVDFLNVKYFICDLLSVIAIKTECLPWRVTKNTVK